MESELLKKSGIAGVTKGLRVTQSNSLCFLDQELSSGARVTGHTVSGQSGTRTLGSWLLEVLFLTHLLQRRALGG